MLLIPNCCRYLEGDLCFGLPVIFPWFLVFLCLQVVVFFFFYFSTLLFSSVCRIACAWGTTVCFFILFPFFFFSSGWSLCLLFCLCLFPFVSIFHRMRMSCMSYPVWLHDIALPTVRTVYLVHGNVVSLWRSFVITELISPLRLKNRHGHWLCDGCRRVERTVCYGSRIMD